MLRLDSTPDYLYSTGTPDKIKEYLNNYKIIFILRNPVDRIISWYRYAKQVGGILEEMNFQEYVTQQLKASHYSTAKKQPVALKVKEKSIPQKRWQKRPYHALGRKETMKLSVRRRSTLPEPI